MDSLFVRDGDTVRPTEHAASPWNPATQAGGAPAALLAQLVEEQASPDLRSARVTVDILGPVPMARGRVRVEPVRRGRATELVDAALEVDGRDVLRIGVWRVAPVPPLPDRPTDPPPTPGPEGLPEHISPQALSGTSGYVPAMQWRMVRGGFDIPGRGAAWSRPRHPLLPVTPTPSLARLMLAAATANGLSGVVDHRRLLSIDVDITVHLERDPRGSWLYIEAITHVESGQAGHVTATFSDEHGRIGRATQTLLMAARA